MKQIYEDFTQIEGGKDGPTSVVLAGVHGDEKCGIIAFEKMLSEIQIERGRVWFGYGNPRAIEQSKRFTEANLNRMFKGSNLLSVKEKKSYEYHRAKFLKNFLNHSEALLDLHASHTPNSKPFAICESNAREIVKYLPVEIVVSGFDRIEPGGTDYYMNSTGKIGVCVECGYLDDPISTEIAEKSIIAFLQSRGHIKNEMAVYEQAYILINEIYITKTNQFYLAKSFADFEKISKGQLIGTDGGTEVRAKKESIILFARNRDRLGEEGFLLGESKKSLAGCM